MVITLSLDDFAWEYTKTMELVYDLAEYFGNFKISLFTIPKWNGDLIGNHSEWLKVLKRDYVNVEFIIHGWEHVTNEFQNLNFRECVEKINKGIYEFKRAGLPIIPGFKAPNWRYNHNLCRALAAKGWWLAIYTEGHHAGSSKDADGMLPRTYCWNWDIKDEPPKLDVIHGHGHVHPLSGPGAYIGECMEKVKMLPNDTEFMFVSEFMEKYGCTQ